MVADVEVAFTKTTLVMVEEATSATNEPLMAKAVVVAAVEVAFTVTRLVMVEVEFATKRAALIVCWAVQVLALPRFKEATTAPVVGEMVKVPSELETDETPVGMQTPSMAKQPSAIVMPFAKVEEAVVPRTSMVRAKAAPPTVVVDMPTPKLVETSSWEVEAAEVTARLVEVAPTLMRLVIVEEAESTVRLPLIARLVAVALVPEKLVTFKSVDEAVEVSPP